MSAGSESIHELTTADGIALHARLAVPPAPIGVLILCHGLTVSCDEHGSFPLLRDAGLAASLAVARFDFRAHGRSGGTNEQLRLAGMRADVDAVIALVQEQLGAEIPLIPIGVSFGGAAAVHAATRPTAAGLGLWYAVIDYYWNYGPESTVRLTRMMRAAASAADPDWSEMPVLSTGYHLSTALIAEMRGDRTADAVRALKIPVLSFHGARDWFVGVEPLQGIARERPNVRVRVLAGAGHGFRLWRPWVVSRTVAWAAAQAVRPPSTTST